MVDENILTMDESLLIAGSGFRRFEPVTLALVIDKSTRVIIGGGSGAQVTANDAGAFLVEFSAIGGSDATKAKAVGIRTILGEGADGSIASVPIMISDAAVPRTGPSSSLAINPVISGGMTTVWIAGFEPFEPVFVSVTGVVTEKRQPVGLRPKGDDRTLFDQTLIAGEANSSGAAMLEAEVALDPGVYTAKAVGANGSEATGALVVTAETK